MRSDQVIEETDTLRLGVLLDESPDAPYDDGRTPILLREWNNRHGYSVSYVDGIGDQPPAHLDELREAFRRWGDDRHTNGYFERYLRIFHGTRAIEYHNARGGEQYVTFDTAEWRARHGFEPDATPVIWLEDYRAYLDGEVYGWVIERQVTWTREGSDEQMHTWETVDSCWGYYGLDDALSEARSAWGAYLEESSK